MASIDGESGLVKTYKSGQTIINYGELESHLSVMRFVKVKQLGKESIKGSSLEVAFQAFW